MRLFRRRFVREMDQHLKKDARLQILNEAEQEYYMTVVADVQGDSFTVPEPLSGGKGLDMPQYSSWQFCLIGEDAVYFFTSRVTGISRDGGDTRYVIRKPDTVHRQQRRGYVRVPCHLNLLYWPWEDAIIPGLASPVLATRSADLWEDPLWIKDYVKELESRSSAKSAFTLDMSGGGLRMVTLDSLERNQRILLKIELDEGRKSNVMLLEAKVVRVVPLNIGGWKRYRVGLTFTELEEHVQESLIGYLFRLMRKKI